MGQKKPGWMRRHWRLLAAVLLGLVVGITIGAICASPAGVPIMFALAGVKALTFLFVAGPIGFPFFMAGFGMLFTLIACALYNGAHKVTDWMDRKINPKKGAGVGSEECRSIPGASPALNTLMKEQKRQREQASEDEATGTLRFGKRCRREREGDLLPEAGAHYSQSL